MKCCKMQPEWIWKGRTQHEGIRASLSARNAGRGQNRDGGRDPPHQRGGERRRDPRRARAVSRAVQELPDGLQPLLHALFDQHRRRILRRRKGLLRRDRPQSEQLYGRLCLRSARLALPRRARGKALPGALPLDGGQPQGHVGRDHPRHDRGEQARLSLFPADGGHGV